MKRSPAEAGMPHPQTHVQKDKKKGETRREGRKKGREDDSERCHGEKENETHEGRMAEENARACFACLSSRNLSGTLQMTRRLSVPSCGDAGRAAKRK